MPTAAVLRAPLRHGAGQRLREIRTARGLSQRKLAYLIDVAIGTIQNYEHGRVDMTLQRVEQIASALNIQPADLFAAPGSELPKYRYTGPRKLMERQDALDHLAAIWDQMRDELRREKGIDVGDQPARDWIDTIQERMGLAGVSPQTSRAAYLRIRRRLEAYHALLKSEGKSFDQSC